MQIKWRVVAIDSTGARIIVDEGLTAERAHEIRDLMIENGHSAVVEPEFPTEFNGHDVVQWSKGDRAERCADISAAETPPG